MDLTNKRVLVVGLGKSGVASAFFLQSRGAQVTVSDAKPQDQLGQEIPLLLDHGIAVETGGHGERTFRGQDLIVVSPGVPVDSPPLVQARALGEPVIGEIELASNSCRGTSSPSPVPTERPRRQRWRAKSLQRADSRRWSVAISARQQSPWSSGLKLTRSWCWKCRASSWRPSRPFVPKLPSCSTSRPTTSTVTALSRPTPTPRRASSRTSKRRISPC